jgi:hypothetical protein
MLQQQLPPNLPATLAPIWFDVPNLPCVIVATVSIMDGPSKTFLHLSLNLSVWGAPIVSLNNVNKDNRNHVTT